MTHYIPEFTRTMRRGSEVLQQAVCGVYIRASEHRVEPSCPTCEAWLVANDAALEKFDQWCETHPPMKEGVR